MGKADSSGRRNSSGRRAEVVVEDLLGGSHSEGLSGSVVEFVCDLSDPASGVLVEVGGLGEVLTNQSVGVLIGASLPWAVGLTEEDVDPRRRSDLTVLGEFGALVPRQGLDRVVWQ